MAKREAMVISVGRFDDRDLAPLPPAPALADLLADPEVGGYEVEAVTNPASRGMRIAIERFFASARPDELRMLYLSSHGIKDVEGKLYFAATDTRSELLAATGVSATFLGEAVRASRCLAIVIILDCTFAGAFQHDFGTLRAHPAAIDPDIGGTGWIVICSSGAYQHAFAPAESRASASGSVFTDALIEGLRTGAADLNGDGTVDVDELFDFLHASVVEASQGDGFLQTPSRLAGLTGRLAFARVPKAPHAARPLPHRAAAELAGVTGIEAAAIEPAGTQPETKVDWATDAPAREDHLNRAPLAEVLASQLREVRRKEPSTSFLVHLDGPWGAGKSSLLNFLEERLEHEFTIVRFDAWRQSRLGPPWWALLSATRKAVARDRHRLSAAWLRMAETAARARRSGAAFVLAVLLLIMSIGVLAAFVLPRVPGTEAMATLAKTMTTVLGAAGLLWAGARVAAKLLLRDSARGARLFEQSNPNPMDQVAAHFHWLLHRSRKPVLVFVDDLDRCPGTYVVDLLDAMQTLVRDHPQRATTGRERSAAYFVVAADGAWLRRSYEDAFPSFHDCVPAPGSSLGHLFLDKIFQLTVPVPAPSARARAGYLDQLLHVADPISAERIRREVEAGKAELDRVDDEAAILRVVSAASPPAREELAGRAALALVAPLTRARTDHALSKFLPLLEANPRTIKKFLNTYNVLRSVRTLEQNTVPSDVLALWTILRVRWPSVADLLEASPEAIRGIVEPLWASECLPPGMHQLAVDASLRAVVLCPEGGPLTANTVRQCSGSGPA
ncbi:P-loop NTPase fold protein [Amycolatopsis lexingtonensis]|uniref:P-loop NTPase fold protein n=1 Tax=Amycolatopsis lexingtonensis TaxID=218822 RepID=UPI003F70512F